MTASCASSNFLTVQDAAAFEIIFCKIGWKGMIIRCLAHFYASGLNCLNSFRFQYFSASTTTPVVTTTEDAAQPSATLSDSASAAKNGCTSATTTTIASTAAVATSGLLTQLSYAQPSIELLRRRQAQLSDAASSGNADDTTARIQSTGGSHGHLLSSATVAALAAIANTPRR